MIRLLSTALMLCLITSAASADIGCTVPCTASCTDQCQDNSCGKVRCKLGCGLRAHGCWLKRKSCCNGGCDTCGDCQQGSCGSGRCGRGGCHGRGCGWFGHRHCIDGQDWYFNCGCNGSYNYPVPPLYTYHWPGMYKAQRMTDYHSPYRFPPLRPYTEEQLAPLIEEVPETGDPSLAPIVHLRPLPPNYPAEGVLSSPGEVESVSSRLERMSQR